MFSRTVIYKTIERKVILYTELFIQFSYYADFLLFIGDMILKMKENEK